MLSNLSHEACCKKSLACSTLITKFNCTTKLTTPNAHEETLTVNFPAGTKIYINQQNSFWNLIYASNQRKKNVTA